VGTARRGRPVPADPAAAGADRRCARARSLWCRSTPGRWWHEPASRHVRVAAVAACSPCWPRRPASAPGRRARRPGRDQVRPQPEAGVERRPSPAGGPVAQRSSRVPAGDDGVPRAHRRRPPVPGHRRARRWDPLAKDHHLQRRGSTTGTARSRSTPGRTGSTPGAPGAAARQSGDTGCRFPMVKENDEWRIAVARRTRSSSPTLVPGPLRVRRRLLPRPDRAASGARAVFVPTEQVAAALVQRLLDGRAPHCGRGRGRSCRRPDPGSVRRRSARTGSRDHLEGDRHRSHRRPRS
jgi:hypothetical protein